MKPARKKTTRTYKKRNTKTTGIAYMRKNLRQMLGDIGETIKSIF